MRRAFSTAALSALMTILVLTPGCGYHVSGRGGKMPGEVAAVSIPFFLNETLKPDIESVITTAFINEFVTTVKVEKEADAIMIGVIRSYSLNAVSFTEGDVNQEYRLTVALSLKLLRGPEGEELLWEDENIVDYEDFTVNITDVAATKDAEAAALRKIARDTARIVKERMLESF